MIAWQVVSLSALEVCQLRSRNIHLKKFDQTEKMNYMLPGLKMSSHTDHCAVFARNVINDISVILDKHTSNNNYFGHKSDTKDKILSNEIPHS